MPVKTTTFAALALTASVVLAGPASAQGAFTQAPLPSMSAAPAAAAPAMPMPAMTAPAAPAQSIAPQASTDCGAIQKTLQERKDLVAKANAASTSKAKITAQAACALFGQLQANGNAGMKWITANKEWCSIPDSFSDGFKADHARVMSIRTKVCGIAAQASKMEAQARAGGGGQQGLLGGPGLSGNFKLPQGAL